MSDVVITRPHNPVFVDEDGEPFAVGGVLRAIDTRAAVEELLLAALPPLRQPGDIERDEARDILERRGYQFRNRQQLCAALAEAGFVALSVWDSEKKGEVTVWRKQ